MKVLIIWPQEAACVTPLFLISTTSGQFSPLASLPDAEGFIDSCLIDFK